MSVSSMSERWARSKRTDRKPALSSIVVYTGKFDSLKVA